MPTAQRIKGQEVSLAIVVDGALQTTIDTIQSAEIELEQDLIEEGYIGETSDRVDSVFKLVRVQMVAHVNSAAYFELAKAIADRSQRRAGGLVRIDITGSFAFPNGDFPSIVIPDVFFEGIPFTIGARDEYVEVTLSGKASNYTIID